MKWGHISPSTYEERIRFDRTLREFVSRGYVSHEDIRRVIHDAYGHSRSTWKIGQKNQARIHEILLALEHVRMNDCTYNAEWIE